MALIPLGAPGAEPLTLELAKAHLRIQDIDLEDPLTLANLQAAREHVEGVTWRALVRQRFDLVLDGFPPRAIRLPRPPLVNVESIAYVDPQGAEVLMDAAHYVVDARSEPGRVAPAPGRSWPQTAHVMGAVRIRFVAGYSASDPAPEGERPVPAGLTLAMRMLMATWHTYREEIVTGTFTMESPAGVRRILGRYRFRGEVDL